MNKYGLPLTAPSKQALIPAMYRSGRMIGYYPITQQDFTGSETSFTLPSGVVIPLTTVTIDADPTKLGRPTQYVAAVWSDGTAVKLQPWAARELVSPAEGGYRFWILPTQTWVLRAQASNLQVALNRGFAAAQPAPTPPGPPTVTTPATLYWQATVDYAALTGDCPFFDFNWVTLFQATAASQALRIVVTTNPPPEPPHTQSPIVAQVIGIPTSVGAGAVRYDTIRIMKLQDEINAGTYTFNFNVYSDDGQTTPAVLTLTVQ